MERLKLNPEEREYSKYDKPVHQMFKQLVVLDSIDALDYPIFCLIRRYSTIESYSITFNSYLKNFIKYSSCNNRLDAFIKVLKQYFILEASKFIHSNNSKDYKNVKDLVFSEDFDEVYLFPMQIDTESFGRLLIESVEGSVDIMIPENQFLQDLSDLQNGPQSLANSFYNLFEGKHIFIDLSKIKRDKNLLKALGYFYVLSNGTNCYKELRDIFDCKGYIVIKGIENISYSTGKPSLNLEVSREVLDLALDNFRMKRHVAYE